MSAEPAFRSYQRADREAIFGIVAVIAFFDDPVEAILEDRGSFCGFFYQYYTDLEPEHGWVACTER